MISPRLLQRKPLLIRLLRNLLPGRNPASSVPPPVKDLLGSVPVPTVKSQLGKDPPGSVPTVKDLPDNVPTVKDLPDSVLTVSIPPAQLPQPTKRKWSALR